VEDLGPDSWWWGLRGAFPCRILLLLPQRENLMASGDAGAHSMMATAAPPSPLGYPLSWYGETATILSSSTQSSVGDLWHCPCQQGVIPKHLNDLWEPEMWPIVQQDRLLCEAPSPQLLSGGCPPGRNSTTIVPPRAPSPQASILPCSTSL
jgi:hypothetical protein